MNIVEAIHDENLFRPFLENPNGRMSSWRNWCTALRALYGIKFRARDEELIAQCTGAHIKQGRFRTALLLVGRRSGKSRIASVIGAYEATLAGRHKRLRRGETGLVAILAPTRRQAGIVRNYIASIFSVPMLAQLVEKETAYGLQLTNHIRVEVLSGDWRTVRGFTLIAAIVDEAAFFGLSEESKVRSDTELMRALKPGLATTGGKLIAISSPYARKGWCFSQYERNYGNNNPKCLVWNCPSRTMNPRLSQEIVDEALSEDRAAALSEYMGQFREDVEEFLPRSVIETFVVKGRTMLMP
jgi:hypothetical protein